MKKILFGIILSLIFTHTLYATEKRIFPEKGIIPFYGMDDTSQPPLTMDGRAADIQNIILDISGSAEKRHGYSLKNAILDTNDETDNFEAVAGLYELYKSNGTRYLIAICADKFFYDNSGTWSRVPSSTITEGANNQFTWTTALDYAIGTNFQDLPLQWNGAGNAGAVLFTGLTNPITKAKCVTWWKNYLIWGNTVEGGVSHVTRIRWSNVGTISTYSNEDFVDISTLGGQQIEGFGILYDDLYIFLTDSIYKVSLVGGDELIVVTKISEGIGCTAKNSIQTINIRNSEGLIFLSRDKTINFLDGVRVTELSTLISNIMSDISTTRFPYAVSANDRANSHYYLSITDSTDSISTTTNNLLLDYNYQTGEWSKHSQIDANCMCIANDSNSNPQVYFGNYKSFVYQMNNVSLNSDVAGLSGRFEDEDLIDTTAASGLTVLYDEDLSSYTVLLSHFEGANGSTVFIDETGKSITANGNSQISTVQYKIGTSSGLFDGAGDYLTLANSGDWNFGTGDFTVEGYIYATDLSEDAQHIICGTSNSDASGDLSFDMHVSTADGKLVARLSSNGTSDDYTVSSSSSAITTNTWYHAAFVRNGNTGTLYKNGTSVGTVDLTGITVFAPTGVFSIGNQGTFLSGTRAWKGYIDEFRISKGIARWTSNFTPPTSAYTNADLSSRFKGGTLTILSGDGAGEERVICDTTSSGIVITDDITSGINALYSIGAIDAYYVTKWLDMGDASLLKNMGELFIWAEKQQNKSMDISYATEYTTTISTDTVNLYGGNILGGTSISGASTWAGLETNFIRKALNLNGRFLKIKFSEDDIDETMKLFGYSILFWPLDYL